MGEKKIDPAVEAERKVACVLDKLKEDGEIFGYFWTKKNGELDRNGIDFLIMFRCGLAMALQIKSARSVVKRHYEKYPQIPCMVVEDRHKLRNVRRRIQSLIRKRTERLLKRWPRSLEEKEGEICPLTPPTSVESS